MGENIVVFWDLHSYECPSYILPYVISTRITTIIRNAGDLGPVTILAYGEARDISMNKREAFNSTGITLVDVPTNTIESQMINGLFMWTFDNPPPAKLRFLINDSSVFEPDFNRLKASGYSVSVLNLWED
ncbi:unnamed protein product [Brassica oleracea var. botrytis]